MTMFGKEITLSDMPSYNSFANSPNHIYTSFQDTLSGALNQPQGPQVVIQQQAQQQAQQASAMPGLASAEQQSNQWK